jgi:hypothetical protein
MDPSGHWIQIAAMIISKAVDYGWTGYDAYNALMVLNDPASSFEQRVIASADLGMASLEAAEFMDESSPYGVPADDLIRVGSREVLKKVAKSGGPRGLVKFIREKSFGRLTLDTAGNIIKYNRKQIAGSIGSGHAFTNHIKEFTTIKSKEALSEFVSKVMKNPTETRKLEGGRDAYFHADTGVVVIYDPLHKDGGTVFKPRFGSKNQKQEAYKYFKEELK